MEQLGGGGDFCYCFLFVNPILHDADTGSDFGVLREKEIDQIKGVTPPPPPPRDAPASSFIT